MDCFISFFGGALVTRHLYNCTNHFSTILYTVRAKFDFNADNEMHFNTLLWKWQK